jgi:hypothetical protein
MPYLSSFVQSISPLRLTNLFLNVYTSYRHSFPYVTYSPLSEVEIIPLVLSRDSRKLPSTPMRQPATRHADTGLHLQRVNRPLTMLLTT